MRLSWLFPVLAGLLLAGCKPPATGPVHVAPGVTFRLCPPGEAAPFFLTQEVIFTLPGGGEEIAQATLENQDGVFSMVASTPVGQTLFIVQVKGTAVTVDARIPIPGDLDPRVLPALVQFALWPAEAVRAALGPGLAFLEEGSRRSLVRSGKTVWVVTRTGDTWPPRALLLENPGLGLSVRVRTLED